MISGSANDEGFYPCECPWIAEHTDAPDTGTGYKPGGRFKCHHGHCADKHRRELSVWVHRRLLAEGQPGLKEWAFTPFEGGTAPLQATRLSEYLDELWRLLVRGQVLTSQDVGRLHLARVPDHELDGLLCAARSILGADTSTVRREIRRARRKIEAQARRAHREETKRALGAIVRVPVGVLAPVSLQEANAALAAQLTGLFPETAGTGAC
jgi:hypothetical protein